MNNSSSTLESRKFRWNVQKCNFKICPIQHKWIPSRRINFTKWKPRNRWKTTVLPSRKTNCRWKDVFAQWLATDRVTTYHTQDRFLPNNNCNKWNRNRIFSSWTNSKEKWRRQKHCNCNYLNSCSYLNCSKYTVCYSVQATGSNNFKWKITASNKLNCILMSFRFTVFITGWLQLVGNCQRV